MAIAILPAHGRDIAGHSTSEIARVAPPAARVPLLVDPRVAVLRLVTALASAGLTIRHDHQRDALVASIVRPQEGTHT